MTFHLTLNGEPVDVDVDADTPLLWVLRDELGATGTKYGCGKGLCGACTVHLDGAAVRSCSVTVDAAQGRAVTTIEGLSPDHPLFATWLGRNVSQCGYCQPGQIMAAAALLARNANPSDEDIDAAMAGNLCRCGTYRRIHAAVADAGRIVRQRQQPRSVEDATHGAPGRPGEAPEPAL